MGDSYRPALWVGMGVCLPIALGIVTSTAQAKKLPRKGADEIAPWHTNMILCILGFPLKYQGFRR